MNYSKNIFTYITIFFLSFTSISYSDVVNKIEVKGNDRIALETIVIFGDIAVGKDYKNSDLNLIIKKLYETTFFKNISAVVENNILTITVRENPIINTIIFKGEKAKKYKEKITEVLLLKEKGSFIEGNIKHDINLMKNYYKSLGFYFVKIDADIQRLVKNKVNLVYSIEKGDKAKIKKIFFLGDKKIRDKKLRDIITSQESRAWKIIARSVYINKERIDLDKRLLKNYYRNKGYYEVDVQSSNVEYSEGNGFVLTFSIDAGKRYVFKKIYANVDPALDNTEFLPLENEFNKLIGKHYSQKRLNSVLEKIDKLSEQKELQFISHNILETLDGNGVVVKINIFEGEKIIIERINIVGNSVTNDSVIRGELIVDEGDPFSKLLVNKSINKLKARNIFGIVEQTTLPGSTADLRVLEIKVEEKATGEIMAGAGIGTDGTSFQFALKENNWLGRGIKLSSTLNLSQEKISGDILLTNPNYNFSGNSVSASLDVSSTDRSGTTGFSSSKTGFGLGTSFEQYENIWFSPRIDAEFEDIEVDATASTQIKKMEGNFFNTDLYYGITADKRNQPFKPTEGYIATFSQSLPIIQDSSSIMNGLDISSYYDFSEDVIGSLKFYARSITGVDDDVRLTNRLYLPKSKLRGFNTYKTGPIDGTAYIGGNYTSALTAEAQLPNLLPESYKTDFSLFFDAGNVWEVDYSSAIDDSNKIRSAIGLSANVYTTIGPLTFTLAQNLSKATQDETETFNFRLGTSF